MSDPRSPRLRCVRPDGIWLEWPDGAVSEFPGIWLRDNDPTNRDPFSGQRLIDVCDLPEDIAIQGATLSGATLSVTWSDTQVTTQLDLAWLRARSPGAGRVGGPERRYWLHGAAMRPGQDFARVPVEDFRAAADARGGWLTRLVQDGIAFLTHVPAVEAALLDVASLVGQVLPTNYGVAYDVRTVPQPENLAYSDLGLGLHLDNPYREPVPGFQALHVLIAAPDGGDSLFADGHAIAEHLRATAPPDFALLTRTPVPFAYRAPGVALQAERPLIQLTCDDKIAAVHYNSRSIGPLALEADLCRRFYGAYRRYAALLRKPEFQMQTHLEAGDLVVFDNQRVLHGRTAFRSARHARHLRGCYLTRDSVLSNAALPAVVR